MSKISVHGLSGAMETLLIPLWSRALESRNPDPVLHDPQAERMVAAIDYDFDQFARRRVDSLGFCVRGAIFDRLVEGFLGQHPGGTVVEIGVGLDTRYFRIHGPGPWFELDLDEPMAVRQQLIGAVGERRMLSGSALNFSWLDELAATRPQAVFVVVEGVFYFWSIPEIVDFCRELGRRFPGARVVFDAHGPLYRVYSNYRHPLADSRLGWSLRSARQVESWDPSFHVERMIGFGDSPQYDPFMHRFSLATRFGRRWFPAVRQAFKIIQLRLGSSGQRSSPAKRSP